LGNNVSCFPRCQVDGQAVDDSVSRLHPRRVKVRHELINDQLFPHGPFDGARVSVDKKGGQRE
jgi:hypothetical protein